MNTPRPLCRQPDACRARGKGHCPSCAQTGRNQSPQEIEKRRQSAKERLTSQETRTKMRVAATGRRHSAETIEKIRATLLRQKQDAASYETITPDWIAKEGLTQIFQTTAAHKGAVEAEHHCQRILANMRAQ